MTYLDELQQLQLFAAVRRCNAELRAQARSISSCQQTGPFGRFRQL